MQGRIAVRRAVLSLLATAGVVGLWAVVMEVRSEYCWVYCWGAARCLLVGGLLGLWVLAFFMLRLRGRLVLVVCAAIVYAGLPHHLDRATTATCQASTVATFRQLPATLDAYRKDHDSQGYPASLPSVPLYNGASRFYRIVYKPIRANPGAGGPVDDYMVTATPNRWCCGFALSLAMRSDGLVHYNYEKRPATFGDPPMPLP